MNTQKIPFATNFNSKTNVHVGDDLNLYVRFSKSFIDECDFNVDLLYSDYPVSLKLIFFWNVLSNHVNIKENLTKFLLLDCFKFRQLIKKK